MHQQECHITVLGSGTAQPLPDRGSPCLLLEQAGRITLLDLGPGALRQLIRVGIPHWAVDQVLVTHFHPDHTGDLVHLLFATRRPEIMSARKPLRLSGPPGFRELIRRLEEVWEPWLTLPEEILTVDELSPDQARAGGMGDHPAGAAWTGHTDSSLAYRLECPSGGSVVYSGDTGSSQDLISLAKNCDLLILECSFPDGGEVAGHLTPASAGELAAAAEARKLLLLHFYPEVLATDIAGACRRAFKGELILGRDLLRIEA